MCTERQIDVVEGDITELAIAPPVRKRFAEAGAIVNAANTALLGGGGVDGAIHRAAGPELLKACRPLGGCPTGEARITPGFNLPARWVIHTVGPVWRDGEHGEDALLASCYRNSLQLAAQHDVRAIAFPAISTGVYRFPRARATDIAVSTVRETLQEPGMPQDVLFVCFSAEAAASYRERLDG